MNLADACTVGEQNRLTWFAFKVHYNALAKETDLKCSLLWDELQHASKRCRRPDWSQPNHCCLSFEPSAPSNAIRETGSHTQIWLDETKQIKREWNVRRVTVLHPKSLEKKICTSLDSLESLSLNILVLLDSKEVISNMPNKQALNFVSFGLISQTILKASLDEISLPVTHRDIIADFQHLVDNNEEARGYSDLQRPWARGHQQLLVKLLNGQMDPNPPSQ